MPDGNFLWQALLTIALAAFGIYNLYIHQLVRNVDADALGAKQAAADAKGEAAGAKAAADIVNAKLAEHKLHAAENFATRVMMEQTERRLVEQLDKIEARQELGFSDMNSKLDRLISGGRRE